MRLHGTYQCISALEYLWQVPKCATTRYISADDIINLYTYFQKIFGRSYSYVSLLRFKYGHKASFIFVNSVDKCKETAWYNDITNIKSPSWTCSIWLETPSKWFYFTWKAQTSHVQIHCQQTSSAFVSKRLAICWNRVAPTVSLISISKGARIK